MGPVHPLNLKQIDIMQNDKPASASEISAPHRVLIVDDNADAASTLGMLIEMLGNHVATANSGREALALGEDFQPRIIFLDLGMPEMDGFATAAKIREQAWGKNIVIVALSGWGQDEDKRKTEAAGFDHHLVKPTELGQLQKLLAEL